MVLVDKLNEIINDNYNKIGNLVIKDLYQMDDIVSLSEKELLKIAGFKTFDELVDAMQERIGTGRYEFDEFRIFISKNLLILGEIKNYLNEKVEAENEQIRQERNNYKRNIKKIKSIISKINSYFKSDEIIQLINELRIDDSEKKELISEFEKYQKEIEQLKKEQEEKQKIMKEKSDQIEEELFIEPEEEFKYFNIKNYDLIKPLIVKYDFLELIVGEINLIFSENELNEIEKFSYNNLEKDIFESAFLSILYLIDMETDNKKLTHYYNYLNELCKKYELKIIISNFRSELKELYSYSNLAEQDIQVLENIQRQLDDIENKKYNLSMTQTIINTFDQILYEIKKDKKSEEIAKNDKLKIKSFILFDYYELDNNEKLPYVLTDLDVTSPKNQIDGSLDKIKIISNGYNDFNDLIDDLIIYDAPRIVKSGTDRIDKVIRPVFYTKDAFKIINTNISNSTGMLRIRPRPTSFVRFIDEKVIFIPGTRKFNQLVDLLESKFKNIVIDRNEPFNFYINYLSAFKYKDIDSYNIAIKRQNVSKLQALLKTEKEEFNVKELEEINEIIDMSLSVYKQLEANNKHFEFESIKKIEKSNILN